MNWTAAPYFVNGRLVQLLEGEDPGTVTPEILKKRLVEYTTSRARQRKAHADARRGIRS